MFQFNEEFKKGSIEFEGHVKFSFKEADKEYRLFKYKEFKSLTELCELLKPETLLMIAIEKNVTEVKLDNVFFSVGNDNMRNQICLYSDGESSACIDIERN